MNRFFPGLHQPSDAKHFQRACISVNRLRARRRPIGCPEVLLDSGAFTELALYGTYRHDPGEYAKEIDRLVEGGVAEIVAAVAQDYMCETFMLAKTGLTVADHQRLTIERYDALLDCDPAAPIMPVLQGYTPDEYVAHLRMYGDRLLPGMWVGVGSVCKRNSDPKAVAAVLKAIHRERPDLQIHAFGLKKTALEDPEVIALIGTSDSMAWSYAARKQRRNANDWREAKAFANEMDWLVLTQ